MTTNLTGFGTSTPSTTEENWHLPVRGHPILFLLQWSNTAPQQITVCSVSYDNRPEPTEGKFIIKHQSQELYYHQLSSCPNGCKALEAFYGSTFPYLYEKECLNAFKRLLHLCLVLLGVDRSAEVVPWTKNDWKERWSQSCTLNLGDYAQFCPRLDKFDQFRCMELSAELLQAEHRALLRRLWGRRQKDALNPSLTQLGNVVLLCASVGVFAVHHPLDTIDYLHSRNIRSIRSYYSMADFTLDLNRSPLYDQDITSEAAKYYLLDSLSICCNNNVEQPVSRYFIASH
ncbi:hypothetical protein ACJ73_07939 [Blastomyces percursus]|uniref:Uncharacterized protein n=1 Tax=Blastomyces percursus TaxID=1658174 RepID=A0A1J9QKI7_9EURO|nr:hypothetical protein ACJ73_07939 [Blastomyces percursus]